MINTDVIKQFLARPLDEWSWIKSADVSGDLPDLGSIKLWKHQQQCFILLNELRRFMLFVAMGGGKTLLTLALIKHRKALGDKPRAVVFVPYITSVDTWVEETAKHTPELKCVPLVGTTYDNLSRLRSNGDLFVICYASAVAMLKDVGVGKKGKNQWLMRASEVRAAFATFNMLVLDESHKCKSATSLTYRMCRAISSQSDWVIGLTGTPFGLDLQDLWPQFNLIDFGETLGPSLGFYREVFFREKPGYSGYPEYVFKKAMLPDLKRMIQHKSIHYGVDEFTDMPPKANIPRRVPHPNVAKGYIEQAVNELNEGIKAKNLRAVESNYLRLRQLSSGFMTLKNDDNKVQVEFEDNPKLDLLEELVDAMPHGHKMVIFHHFVHTNAMISQRLTKMGRKHARIWGGQKDPIRELRRFRDDASVGELVLNLQSGSSSLNLQHANFVVFFEQPDSPITRQQAEARCWRKGQARRVFFYDLLVDGTVDHKILLANQAGKELLRELMEGNEVVA